MSEQEDPFTGTWRFNPQRSTRDEVHVHETIIRLDGSQTIVEVMASFGGGEYPVIGSPAADTIAYRRVSGNSISTAALT